MLVDCVMIMQRISLQATVSIGLYLGEQGRNIQGECRSTDEHSYAVTQTTNRYSVATTRFSFSASVLLQISRSPIVLETRLWWQVLQHACITASTVKAYYERTLRVTWFKL
jgi:hypothetical protein